GVFFFFQAEDGIRDRNVTGVQTCALPILEPPKRQKGDQVPRVQTRSRRVEPAIERHAPLVQVGAQGVDVGRLPDEAPPLQVIENVVGHGGHCPPSPSGWVTGRGCVIADARGLRRYAETSRAPASQNRQGRSGSRETPTRGPVLMSSSARRPGAKTTDDDE